ncbi:MULTISPECIES: nuclear transport factor 2 family protein [Caballeronia]|uniref:nuclear transport factor 2 family protein n=1 Tax=Caballeronia TaxID=1827195 RepID=UPI001FD61A5F|nr:MULTISPECIES: nuclear transport factor 2 family protein [Caballeronia]MDR5799143.1 nuclear transport factor 2 family protein [Caballeronia sp. LZ001]
MQTSEHFSRQELLNNLTDAWNTQDVDKVMNCFVDHATYHIAFGPEALGQSYEGKTAIRSAVAQGFASYKDGKLSVTSMFVAGEQGAARWLFSYTGVDGKPAVIHGVDVYEFSGDKLKSKDVYVKYFVA